MRIQLDVGTAGNYLFNFKLSGNFNEIDISRITKPTDILNKDFYVNVVGRESASPTLQNIYEHILGELGFVGGFNQDSFSMGVSDSEIPLDKYAFTLDKKVNSKKLLE